MRGLRIRLLVGLSVLAGTLAFAFTNCGDFSPVLLKSDSSSVLAIPRLEAACEGDRINRFFESRSVDLHFRYDRNGQVAASGAIVEVTASPAWSDTSSLPSDPGSVVLVAGRDEPAPAIRFVVAGASYGSHSKFEREVAVASDLLREQSWFAFYSEMFKLFRYSHSLEGLPTSCLGSGASGDLFSSCLSTREERYTAFAKVAGGLSGAEPTHVIIVVESEEFSELQALSFVRDRISILRKGVGVSDESVSKAILHQVSVLHGRLLPAPFEHGISLDLASKLHEVFFAEPQDSVMNRFNASPMYTPRQVSWVVAGQYREFPLLGGATAEGEVSPDSTIRAFSQELKIPTLKMDWYLDGQRLDRTGQSELIVRSLDLSSGAHEIRAIAFDQGRIATDEGVKANCLSMERKWTVVVNRSYQWEIGDWSACPTACGSEGTQFRSVRCLRDDGKAASAELCAEPKPIEQRTCAANLYPRWEAQPWTTCSAQPVWQTGAWGSCAEQGGQGRRTRDVACANSVGEKQRALKCMSCDGRPLAEADCAGSERPSISQTCSQNCSDPEPNAIETGCDFHSYRWKTSAWSSCSASCGTGTKIRDVQCERDDGVIVADSFCGSAKPERSQSCEEIGTPRWDAGDWGACSAQPNWQMGQWSACSASCGAGEQNRSVMCRDQAGENRRVVRCLRCDGQTIDERLCDQASRPIEARSCTSECTGPQPVTSQACQAYSYAWKATEWGACSATPTWSMGAWGSCSSSCGPGTQSRTVACSGKVGQQTRTATCQRCDGVTVPSADCSSVGPEPAQAQSCEKQCDGSSPIGTQTCQVRACADGEGVRANCGEVKHGATCIRNVKSETVNPTYPSVTSPRCVAGTPFETVSYSSTFICDDGTLRHVESTPRYFMGCVSSATAPIIDPISSTCPP